MIFGKGFILDPYQANVLVEENPKNKDVLFPFLNGDDLNNNYDQRPSRWVINFLIGKKTIANRTIQNVLKYWRSW